MNRSRNESTLRQGKQFHTSRRSGQVWVAVMFAAVLVLATARGQTLLLHYDFEGASGGIIPDTTGNGYTGTLAGGTIISGAPQGSSAVQNPFIALPNSGSTPAFNLPGDAFSIATWVRLPLVNNSLPPNIQAIFGNSPGGWAQPGLRLYVNSYQTLDGRIMLEQGDGTSGTSLSTAAGAFPSDGAWHHIAVTVDRADGAAAIYLDGLQRATNGGSLLRDFAVSTSADVIGQFVDHNFQMQGDIDDFRIYSGLLTQTQVAALVPEPACVALLGLGSLLLLCIRSRRGNGAYLS